jgi:hypothetical protein
MIGNVMWQRPMELDVFVPSFSLAFEYQGTGLPFSLSAIIHRMRVCAGQHHYQQHRLFGDPHEWETADQKKLEFCTRYWLAGLDTQYSINKVWMGNYHSLGITLVRVPFWWDHSAESLAATVHKMRPGSIH